MGKSSRSSSSSSVNSSSSYSSAWSRASGLSDVTERGIVTRTKDVGKMNTAQKIMAYTLGIRADSRKRHRVKAQMLEWEGVDEQGRVVTWLTDAELSWTTSARYRHDEDERPSSKASSRRSQRHHRGPQGRQAPPPQIRPGPPMGPGAPFMGGGAGPGPMPPPPPHHGGPPPPPQHCPPGPTPMPPPGAWGPPPGVPQDAYDDETSSYSSGYDESDDGYSYDDGMYGQPGPPPPPRHFQPGPPPPPPAAATSDTLDDGAAFIQL